MNEEKKVERKIGKEHKNYSSSELYKLIRRRSLRWTLVNLILVSSPIIFSILISFLNASNSITKQWYEVVELAFTSGTLIVIAVGLSGTQYLSFAYARDYEKLDSATRSKIGTGFLIISTVSTLIFTIAQNTSFNKDTLDIIILYSLTIIIVLFSIVYTYRVHRVKVYYDYKYNGLVIPMIEGDINLEDELIQLRDKED